MATLLLTLSAFLLAPPATAADRRAVDAYLHTVARHTPTPGVYVDPAVLRTGRLTPQQIATIRAQAAQQPARLHLLVLPAARLTLAAGGVGPAHLAYSPRAMIGRLHAWVGKPGTYAVITSAPTRRAGLSFYAYQWAGGGRSYDTGAAVRQAIACCAPSYGPMLLRFVALSAVPLHHGKPGKVTQVPHHGFVGDPSLDTGGGGFGGAGPFAFVALLLGVAVVGSIVVRSARGSRGPTGYGGPAVPPASVDDLRGPLGEEIEQVRQQISAADTGAATPDPGAGQIAAARQALDLAHAQMTTMSRPADAQAVAAALADARYQVAAAVAVRNGRPVPDRTPPCFVDPRHGPSVTTGVYPPSGLAGAVPLCAASLAAGSAPTARSFMVGGLRMYPWMPYGAAWWYLNGYWGGQPFLQQMSHHDQFLGGNFDHPGHRGPDSGGGSGFGGFGGGHGGGGGFGGGGGHHGGGGFGGGGGGGFGGGHGGGGGFGGGGGGGGGHGH